MSEEPEKKKKSRPKSEVVKSSNVDGEKRKHSSRNKTAEDGDHPKKSHSKKSHSHHVRSAEVEQLKKEFETAKEQIASLQKENEELASKKAEKSSSSSSSQNGAAEENSKLKSQVDELEDTIGSLRDEIANLKAQHDRALEAEFEKLASAQNQIKALNEKLEDSGKPKPITGPKVSFQQPQQPAPQQQQQVSSAISPRGGANKDGSIPAWKLREMEKQKEAEEARNAETQRKLQKVASIRLTSNDVHKDTETPSRNFKDPLENKQPTTTVDDEPEIVRDSAPLLDVTAEEKAAAEMARLGKTLKRGGHNI